MTLKILEESKSGLFHVEDETGNDYWTKQLPKEPKKLRIFSGRITQKFTPSFSWSRVVEILKSDAYFRMPISCSPSDEVDVLDEIFDADSGLTIASERKLATSYDVVFSSNQELESLLRNMGVTSVPFFNSDTLRLAHGPRKAFYLKLIESGFEPSKLGE